MNAPAPDTLRGQSRGISAGIFAAPLGHLAAAAAQIAAAGGRMLHFDVMDGVFVPAITGGPGFVADLGAGMLRDVHLMVARPEQQVLPFAVAGADIITVHAEAPGAAEALAAVRAASARLARPILAGLGVMPGTPLGDLRPLIGLAPDLVLVLALDPRSEAPPDLAAAGERLRLIRQMAAPFAPLMAIDGGVTAGTLVSPPPRRPTSSSRAARSSARPASPPPSAI